MKEITLDSIIEREISKAILDGQNQIHDLKSGKATPEEVTERMNKSCKFHTQNIKVAVLLMVV